MMSERERRSSNIAPTVETREDGARIIRGVAPVYYREDVEGTEFRLWGKIVERVRPGAAVSATQDGADVLSLQNHDSNRVLGRTTAGTLALEDSARGLEFEVEPPDTPSARELLASLERGDVRGSSFMFSPLRVSWEDEYDEDGELTRSIRWLEELRIWEVGPVTFPAYAASTSEVVDRDHATLAAEREAFLGERGDPLAEYKRKIRVLDSALSRG